MGQLFHAIEQLIVVVGVDLHDVDGICLCKECVIQIADFCISDVRIPDAGSYSAPLDCLEPDTKMMKDSRA